MGIFAGADKVQPSGNGAQLQGRTIAARLPLRTPISKLIPDELRKLTWDMSMIRWRGDRAVAWRRNACVWATDWRSRSPMMVTTMRSRSGLRQLSRKLPYISSSAMTSRTSRIDVYSGDIGPDDIETGGRHPNGGAK